MTFERFARIALKKKHINFFNINFLPPTQNPPCWAPRKKFMCLISWERTQKKDPHKLVWGYFWGQKGAIPERAPRSVQSRTSRRKKCANSAVLQTFRCSFWNRRKPHFLRRLTFRRFRLCGSYWNSQLQNLWIHRVSERRGAKHSTNALSLFCQNGCPTTGSTGQQLALPVSELDFKLARWKKLFTRSTHRGPWEYLFISITKFAITLALKSRPFFIAILTEPLLSAPKLLLN